MQIGAGILQKWSFECSGLDGFCQWKTELLNLLLCGATYFIHLFNMDLTDVFRTTQCLSVQKFTQIGSGVSKMWAVKHSGSVFWPIMYKVLYYIMTTLSLIISRPKLIVRPVPVHKNRPAPNIQRFWGTMPRRQHGVVTPGSNFLLVNKMHQKCLATRLWPSP